ncbi:M28 family peptidase [Sphingopyxis sp. RIFCSPHIGHO2_12_FULL_65_19]|uniref:M28 family peptidase n=1 Tax=Sphingopyxis sp. RIFCSPHIGHO2_12_FULL_65_19 TaxID=1802172 RepID=UPI000A6EF359|nr:M28 family peptidase [Sphingopyxis sp. RIFCSPHIGHO2_12_FULL_65_19]
MKTTRFHAAVAAIALFAIAPAASAAPAKADAPVTEAQLAEHIRILAGDAFEGRAPGTEGEDRTIAYVVGEWAKAGLVPVPDSTTPWLQPVPFVETQALSGSAKFKANGRDFAIGDDGIILTGRDASVSLVGVPAVFVGYGVDGTGKVNADVAGKLAIMLFDNAPFGDKLPRYRERRQMLADAGASAVLVISTGAVPWPALRESLGSKYMRLASAKAGAPVSGFLSPEAGDALLKAAGQDGAALREAAKSPDYKGAALPVTADFAAQSAVRPFASHNVIAKLPGAKPDGKAVLFLGHWDHLGICAPEGAADRICNGAVDNASGIAVLIEVAKRLGKGARPDRDIYFLATTAEEKGLLGAHYFADHPVVPLSDITVALNVDTIAISPRGTPVATIGRGKPAYDAVVRDAATRLGRKLDGDGEADAFIQRQDGWALGAKGVTSLMVGGSFSDMKLLEAFLGSDYHRPADNFSDKIPLGGAAEDADLHVALGRAFADTKAWSGTEK